MADLVIENDISKARAVVPRESLREWQLRGFTAVGYTSVPSRALTDDEQAALDAALAADLAALAAPKSDAAPASSRPSK